MQRRVDHIGAPYRWNIPSRNANITGAKKTYKKSWRLLRAAAQKYLINFVNYDEI